MRTISTSWQPAWLSSMAMLLAAFAAALPTAKAAVDEPEGRIVEIAPAGDDELPTVHDEVIVEEDEARTGEEQAPVFWIGIRGRVVDEPVLRTQFQLASDMGLVVEEVLKGSPAAEAGLRKHDVLLRANGEPLTAMDQLTKLVRSGNGKAVKLLLLRLGKEETISVVPQPMPADLRALGTNRNRRGGGDMFQDMFGGDGNIIRMLPNGGMGLNAQVQMNNQLPNGYSVSITRQNNEPAQITVKKGDQTWTVTGDDAQALEELPAEVRDQVKGMLDNPGVNFGMGNLPNFGRDFQMQFPRGMIDRDQIFDFGNERREQVLQRMEELERQLREMQQRLDEERNR